jgi:hypothetical protein
LIVDTHSHSHACQNILASVRARFMYFNCHTIEESEDDTSLICLLERNKKCKGTCGSNVSVKSHDLIFHVVHKNEPLHFCSAGMQIF